MDLKRTLGQSLEREGFVRRGQTWYLNNDKDAIGVINLQKSDWSNLYYINVGLWLRGLGEDQFPKENRCHVSFRPEVLFPDARELLPASCSLDDSNAALLADLAAFMVGRLIPFVRDCTDLRRLRQLVLDGSLRGAAVTADAKRLMFDDRDQA